MHASRDILDDSRLEPDSKVKAEELKDACLSMFKRTKSEEREWNSCFRLGTVVSHFPLVSQPTQDPQSVIHMSRLLPDRNIHIMDKTFEWLDSLTKREGSFHTLVRFQLPWRTIKTAICCILTVAKSIAPHIYDAIIDAVSCIIERMPRIVEHAPTILRATYSPGAIFYSFGESMKLAFIQIAEYLSALAEYLCGIVDNPARRYRYKERLSVSELESPKAILALKFDEHHYEKCAMKLKDTYPASSRGSPELRSRVSLFVVDSKKLLRTLREQRINGSCNWIRNHPAVSDWIAPIYTQIGELTNQRLWLCGEADSGKSVVVAHIISELEALQSSDEITLYFFCGSQQCTMRHIICSLIGQLCAPNLKFIYGFTRDALDDLLFRSNNPKDTREQVDTSELTDILVILLRCFSKARIIIDGLDACERHVVESLMDVLDNLFVRLELSSRLKVLLTSRSRTHINHALRDWKQVKLGDENTTQSDLREYINRQIIRMEQVLPYLTPYHNTLLEALLEASDHSFVYAKLVADKVTEDKDASLLINEECFKDFPQGLTELYERILEDDMQRSSMEENALRCRILQWLTYCEESIPILVLQDMLANQLGLGKSSTVTDVQTCLEKLLGVFVKFFTDKDNVTKARLVNRSLSNFLRALVNSDSPFPTNLLPLKEFMEYGSLHVKYECGGTDTTCINDLLPCLHFLDLPEDPQTLESDQYFARHCVGNESLIFKPDDGEILYWIFTMLQGHKVPNLKERYIPYFVDSIQQILLSSEPDVQFLIRLLWIMLHTHGLADHIRSQQGPQHYFIHYILRVQKATSWHSSKEYILPYLHSMAICGHAYNSRARSRLRTLLLDLHHSYRTFPGQIKIGDVTELDTMVARGGFGEVVDGMHKGQVVALKRLKPFFKADGEQADDEESYQNLCREGLIWYNLKHPHVVPLIGIGKVLSEYPCIVMPFMEKGNIRGVLRERMKEGGESSYAQLQCQVHKWLHQISSGLIYVHREDVVHGDLSGPNILIDKNDNACITDFGTSVVAKKLNPQSYSQRGGAFSWCAPERFPWDRKCHPMDLNRPEKPCDIYSFACVCLELYTAARPDEHLIRNVQNYDQTPPPDFLGKLEMPDGLWKLMVRCWSVSPQARPEAEELAKEISRIVGSSDT